MKKSIIKWYLVIAILTLAISQAFSQKNTKKNEFVVALQNGDNALSTDFCIGSVQEKWSLININLDDSKKIPFRVRVESEKLRVRTKKDGKRVIENVLLPDTIINFQHLASYYCRPRLQRYTNLQQMELKKKWDSLPAASKQFINFEVRQDDKGIEIYLNGQYAGRRDCKGKLKNLTFILPKEGVVKDQKSFKYYQNPEFLPLDIKCIDKPGVMKDAKLSLETGLQVIEDIPMLVSTDNADIGLVKQMKGSWALECDEHLARTALDGMPETAHFSVPQAYYTRAWALCAVEPETYKQPIITARLTRFARSGRAEAISDTTLTLPRENEKPEKGITKVGTVSYEKDGEKIEVPLFLVEFKLKLGEILDLLAMQKDPQASMSRQPYLDFEFSAVFCEFRNGDFTGGADLAASA